MHSTISLVLIDDNRLLREGLASLIRDQPGFTILAASADIDEAVGGDSIAVLDRTGLPVLGMRVGSQEENAGFIALTGRVAGNEARAVDLI